MISELYAGFLFWINIQLIRSEILHSTAPMIKIQKSFPLIPVNCLYLTKWTKRIKRNINPAIKKSILYWIISPTLSSLLAFYDSLFCSFFLCFHICFLRVKSCITNRHIWQPYISNSNIPLEILCFPLCILVYHSKNNFGSMISI